MLRLLRTLASLACLLLVSGLGLAAGSTRASATSTLLCRGYAGCNSLGMSADGYQASSGTMWWRMYTGHNCTNYAAYRMVKSGLPNIRPWSGSGNASNWGHANASLTDSVPAVGAVAWWDAYVRPAGSAGHVAYVERVISADEIIVSQDSWGGDFSWARITRSGGSWPSGFVHFNDVALRNTVRPAVSGTPKVGARLTASTGTWSQTGATYSYQWLADGAAITNATTSAWTLKLAQQGKRISVRVTAAKTGFPTVAAVSTSTVAVAPGQLTNTSPPTISGQATVDSPLTALPGSWSPTPAALTYQWAAGGAPIQGATGSTLVPGADLVDKPLTVTVTAAKAGYSAVAATSAASAPVALGTLGPVEPPTVTGTPRLSQTLQLAQAGDVPENAAMSIQWLRAGVPVQGRTGATYQLTEADLGARIRARTTLTKPGYTPVGLTTGATRPVKSVSTMKVALTSPAAGRLNVSVGISAPAVTPVTGSVRIRWRGTVIRQVTLVDGATAATIRGLPHGLRYFRVRYVGSATATAATVDRAVRIT